MSSRFYNKPFHTHGKFEFSVELTLIHTNIMDRFISPWNLAFANDAGDLRGEKRNLMTPKIEKIMDKLELWWQIHTMQVKSSHLFVITFSDDMNKMKMIRSTKNTD